MTMLSSAPSILDHPSRSSWRERLRNRWSWPKTEVATRVQSSAQSSRKTREIRTTLATCLTFTRTQPSELGEAPPPASDESQGRFYSTGNRKVFFSVDFNFVNPYVFSFGQAQIQNFSVMLIELTAILSVHKVKSSRGSNPCSSHRLLQQQHIC